MQAHPRFILIAVFLASFFLVPAASAHRPEIGPEQGITEISSPSTSFAFYRELTAPEQVDVYRFEAEAGQFFHAGINIPQLSGLESFGVTLALIGPGLPPLEADHSHEAAHEEGHHDDEADHNHEAAHEEGHHDDEADHNHEAAHEKGDHDHEAAHEKGDEHKHAHLESWDPGLESLSHSAGLDLSDAGRLVVPSVRSEDFYEPFTQTNFWGRQVLELHLPATGTYYIQVWNPDGATGKYVLDTGTEEMFGLSDLFRFPIWWLNVRLYFEQGPQLIGGVFALFTGLVAVVVYRRRR